MPIKQIGELSLEEVKLVVSGLHERVQMPQLELQQGTVSRRELWSEVKPADPESWLRDCEGDSLWGRAFTRNLARHNTEEQEVSCAREALRIMLEHVGLPTDEVEVPDELRTFAPRRQPIVTIGDRQYVLLSVEATLRPIPLEPEFEREKCQCGRYAWNAKRGYWYWRYLGVQTKIGCYCSKCGSLLGPNGWTMPYSRNAKGIPWPSSGLTMRAVNGIRLSPSMRRTLIDSLQCSRSPANEANLSSPTSFSGDHPIDAVSGVDIFFDIPENDTPKFRLSACQCRSYIWRLDDSAPTGWYRHWPCDPAPTGIFCGDCGSLLGPNGHALINGRDPESVRWPGDPK